MKIEIEIEEDCLDSLFEEIKQNGYARRQFIEYFTFSYKREKLLEIGIIEEVDGKFPDSEFSGIYYALTPFGRYIQRKYNDKDV